VTANAGAERSRLVATLQAAGFIAAEEEADELLAAASSSEHLATMLARRMNGEPTAWITGVTRFLGSPLAIKPGVYVPRWHTESIARHAAGHLGAGGAAADLCTGSGAIAAYLVALRPTARIIATDIDPSAVACARSNGIEAYVSDLFENIPLEWRERLDVIVAVPPYVPEAMLKLLPRDVVAHEPRRALVGGESGLDVVDRIIAGCCDWLRPGARLVIEVGVDQVDEVARRFEAVSLSTCGLISDDGGDLRGVCGTRP